jgi:hypothetical protein
MPLMVFFALGLVQLTMLQQAKLFTEYAAYQAARAGIVWNGSNERMHDAALLALAPTLGRTDDLAKFTATLGRAQRDDAAMQRLHGLVRVDTLGPAASREADWKELDFDQDGVDLQLRLRYWYELRIPFAGWIVFISWLASNGDVALHGPIDRPALPSREFGNLDHPELVALWALAGGGRYFVPLSATYSMRMQSNFHRKWVMH